MRPCDRIAIRETLEGLEESGWEPLMVEPRSGGQVSCTLTVAEVLAAVGDQARVYVSRKANELEPMTVGWFEVDTVDTAAGYTVGKSSDNLPGLLTGWAEMDERYEFAVDDIAAVLSREFSADSFEELARIVRSVGHEVRDL